MTPRVTEFPEGLDCLIHSARRQRRFVHSSWASTLLVLVGLATMAFHGASYASAEHQVRREFEERIGTSYPNNPELQKYIKYSINQQYAYHGGGTAVGLIHLLLAAGVFWAPIACLTTSLSMYVADWVIGLVLVLSSGNLFESGADSAKTGTLGALLLSTVIHLAVIGLFIASLRGTILFRRALLLAEKGGEAVVETDDEEE